MHHQTPTLKSVDILFVIFFILFEIDQYQNKYQKNITGA